MNFVYQTRLASFAEAWLRIGGFLPTSFTPSCSGFVMHFSGGVPAVPIRCIKFSRHLLPTPFEGTHHLFDSVFTLFYIVIIIILLHLRVLGGHKTHFFSSYHCYSHILYRLQESSEPRWLHNSHLLTSCKPHRLMTPCMGNVTEAGQDEHSSPLKRDFRWKATLMLSSLLSSRGAHRTLSSFHRVGM
jgi:hypothetical protein